LRVRESNRSFPPSWTTTHGLAPETMYRIVRAIGEVLPGQRVTREQLTAAVAAHLGSPDVATAMASSWGVVLKPAAALGVLYFGPDEGRNVTFVAPSDWLGRTIVEPAAGEAMRWALLRFLDAFGPATPDDFRRWWGDQRASPSNRLVEAHAEELVAVSVEGVPMWVSSDAIPDVEAVLATDRRQPEVHLLPAFDPYVIAPRSARPHIIPRGREAEVSRTAGWISQVLLVDGRVEGVWTHERASAELLVQIHAFQPPPRNVRDAAARRAADLAALLGTTAQVRWT
jgi:Winged helix DNA-binding domain